MVIGLKIGVERRRRNIRLKVRLEKVAKERMVPHGLNWRGTGE